MESLNVDQIANIKRYIMLFDRLDALLAVEEWERTDGILSDTHLKEKALAVYREMGGVSKHPDMERICVNYLRHSRSPYDALIKHKPLIEKSVRFAVYDAIGRMYPFLKDEAMRQNDERAFVATSGRKR